MQVRPDPTFSMSTPDGVLREPVAVEAADCFTEPLRTITTDQVNERDVRDTEVMETEDIVMQNADESEPLIAIPLEDRIRPSLCQRSNRHSTRTKV